MTETYGINLTPHFEKYQNQDDETATIHQATWNFGNKLKAKGYRVVYMHGPIALYEGLELKAELFYTDTMSFEEEFPDKKQYLFFLYQVTEKQIRMAKVLHETVMANRIANKKPKKRKKALDNPEANG